MSTWALETIFVYFIFIETNNDFCWLSFHQRDVAFHLQKCRFFTFSRNFDWIGEIFRRICPKTYREAWKTSSPIHFVQISSLTVAFLTGWVKNFYFFKWIWNFIFLHYYLPKLLWCILGLKKRFQKWKFEHPRQLNQAMKFNITKTKKYLNLI